MTLQLTPETAQALTSLAQTRGVSVEEYLDKLVKQETSALPSAELSAEQWVAELKAWAASHSNLPVLSDEAMSREFIYADRGL